VSHRTIYQHPLAYLIGLEGIALLRAFSGDYDRKFTLARLQEIRQLLESPDALGAGAEARPISTQEGYDAWAPSYDGVDSSPGMLAFAREKIPQGELHEADLHELPLAASNASRSSTRSAQIVARARRRRAKSVLTCNRTKPLVTGGSRAQCTTPIAVAATSATASVTFMTRARRAS
jgi:hypothetical protein